MDRLLRFCTQRDPQILVYKAVFEIIEDLKCPVENRVHLLEQLVAPDSEPDERAEIATFIAELFAAYLFPMSSKQNALEKMVEAVESYLDPKLWRGGAG